MFYPSVDIDFGADRDPSAAILPSPHCGRMTKAAMARLLAG
jgi:hypothetical protein